MMIVMIITNVQGNNNYIIIVEKREKRLDFEIIILMIIKCGGK